MCTNKKLMVAVTSKEVYLRLKKISLIDCYHHWFPFVKPQYALSFLYWGYFLYYCECNSIQTVAISEVHIYGCKWCSFILYKLSYSAQLPFGENS